MKRENWQPRRKFLVNRRFQLSFLFWNFVMTAATIGIYYGATIYLFDRFYAKAERYRMGPTHKVVVFLNEQAVLAEKIYFVSAALIVLVLGIGAMILSHRVAGPICRLDRHINSVVDGEETGPIFFRPRDYFRELAGSCNRLFAKLEQQKKGKSSDDSSS